MKRRWIYALSVAVLVFTPLTLSAQLQEVVEQPVEEVIAGSPNFDPTAIGEDNADAELLVSFDKFDIEADHDLFRNAPQKRICPTCCQPLPGGLDHIANGTGARNAGHGTIRLRGAPATAVPVRATLFWGFIAAGPVAATATINFEGHPVVGSLVGTAGQPCWNAAGSYRAYRANVLQYLAPAIDGDYQVDGIPTAVVDGHDPWTPAVLTLPMAQGASLVVIYSDASVPNTSRVYVHTGPWLFTSFPLTVTHSLFPPLPGNSLLRHTRIGGDGQVGGSVSPIGAVTAEQTLINATLIQGPTSPGNDSDWNGSDGGPLNQLWDTRTTNAPFSIPVGAGSYSVTYTNVFDCVNPTVHVLTGR